LVQPFRRLGGERIGSAKGVGLGLSIVAAITETHQGSLDLQARPTGGLRVTVCLPLARNAKLAGATA
jgi:signal transduction histidine kinase